MDTSKVKARSRSMSASSLDSRNNLLDAMFGLVNVIILAPVCVSFTSIIFSHPIFIPYLPSLTKLVLLSCAIHQACFTMFSSLPFAVGQVQDAGLIFLSAMAYAMVEDMTQQGYNEGVIMTTVLVVLSICTFMLGIALVIIGRLRFAVLVQYIPVPVIGGYLAFIGFFCFKAGLVLMTGIQTSGIHFIKDLLLPKMVALWFPGVCFGTGMYLSLRTFSSPYVLPLYMAFVLIVFYTYLFVNDMSLQNARDVHLIAPLTRSEPFYTAWKLYENVENIAWKQLPKQFFRWVGMFVVVAFSSSLDVAAIEMQLKKPLDYNHELQTVGISNVMSGLFGGYTGSYIFSQTIFTMKRKVNSRLCGWVIVAGELIVMAFPFAITSYLPKLLFGTFLTLIGVDLMFEWLVAAREKIRGIEFMVCWLTFLSMHFAGVEGGLLLGTLFSTVGFVITYAETTVVEPNFKSSTVVRTFRERALLIENRGKFVTLSLHGHIFFGSAVKILEDVKRHVVFVDEDENDTSYYSNSASITSCLGNPMVCCSSPGPEASALLEDQGADTELVELGETPPVAPTIFSYLPSTSQLKPSLEALGKRYSFVQTGASQKSTYGAVEPVEFGNTQTMSRNHHSPKLKSLSTEFLVIDFERVIGIDATAARSCFLMLVQLMHQSNVTVVFTNMKSRIEENLRSNHVITDKDVVIPLLDDALEWCEQKILSKRAPSPVAPTSPSAPMPSSRPLTSPSRSPSRKPVEVRELSYYANASSRRMIASESKGELSNLGSTYSGVMLEQANALKLILEDYLGDECAQHNISNQEILKYFDRNSAEDNALVFDAQQASEYVYFLEEGEIELVKISTVTSSFEDPRSTLEFIERVNKINAGGIFGESDFFLSALHSVRAFTVGDAIYWTLSKKNLEVMEAENPKMCLLIQRLLLKSLSINTQNNR